MRKVVSYALVSLFFLIYASYTFTSLAEEESCLDSIHIEAKPEYKIELRTTINYLDDIIVKDTCGNVIEHNELFIMINDTNVNYNEEGIYDVIYNVNMITDTKPLWDSKGIKVTIKKDLTPPTVSITQTTFEVNTDISLKDFIETTDNYDTNVDVEVDDTSVQYNRLGSYKITGTATDDDGNVATFEYDIELVDTTKPVITCLDELTFVVNETPNWQNYLAITDNYDSYMVPEISSYNINALGDYEISITVKDSSGNSVTKNVLVHVVDSVEPSVQLLKTKYEAKKHYVDWMNYLEINDNYDTEVNVTIDDSQINFYKLGQYILKVKVEDTSNNIKEYDFLIEVVDTKKPIITGYQDITIKIDDKFDPLSNIYAYDQFDGVLTDKIEVNGDYDVSRIGKYKISVSVSDESGNTTVVDYILTVEDHPPVVLVVSIIFGILLVIGCGGVLYYKWIDLKSKKS